MSDINRSLHIMRAAYGIKKQTFVSIEHYIIGNAYEVADAVEQEDYAELKNE